MVVDGGKAEEASSPVVPRGALIGAAVLIALAITAGLTVRGHEGALPAGPPSAERELLFADRADHAVVISDARTGGVVEIATGEQGFLRATMRTFAQERQRLGVGEDVPFRLMAWPDGRLTLADPATGRHTDLEAFGRTNEAVFARLLGGGA